MKHLNFSRFITLLSFIISTTLFSQNIKECDMMIEDAINKMLLKQHSESLEILVKTKSIAENKKWDKQAFKSTNAIGLNYYMIMDYGEALKYYLEAYDIASNMKDKSNVMTVLNNIAILYLQEKNNKKAYEYFFKAYNTATENNVKEKMGFYAVNLGFALNKLNKPEEAKKYIVEAKALIKDNPNVIIMDEMAMAENLLIQKKYKESEKIALDILPQLQSISQKENKIFILLLLSKLYEEINDLTKAEHYALEARNTSSTIKDRIEIYDNLSRINAKTKQYDQSLAYKDSVVIANDSMLKTQNSNLFNNGKIKFEIQNYQFELKESQQRLIQERKILYIVIASAFIIIILVIWLFRNNSIKHQQKQKIADLEIAKQQSDNLLLEKQLKEQETLALLEKERLKNELESHNRKLASRAVHISSRNEIIEEIINAISQQPDISSNHHLRKYIQDLKIQLKNDNQWDSFFTHFEGVNQGFLTRLKSRHPDLIPGEIRFITYIYMNLSNKEIASLLNITPHSCRKRKERLSKKLSIPDTITLYDYLSSI